MRDSRAMEAEWRLKCPFIELFIQQTNATVVHFDAFTEDEFNDPGASRSAA